MHGTHKCMSLRDLKEQLKLSHSGLEKHKIVSRPHKDIQNIDPHVACKVVDHIFNYIDVCLKEDKSKIKLSLFAKSFIRGILTDSVRNGINDFIFNMNDKEVKDLLDDMQKELNKRMMENKL
jgi:hypothetical protein